MNLSLNPYIQELVHVYSEYADVKYAEWSRRYLRNQFDFLGIRTPLRRNLTKQFINKNGLPQADELKDIIVSLWKLPEREYQKAALNILEKVKKDLTSDDLEWNSPLIVKKSWWDGVDVLSPHIIGHLFFTNPEYIDLYANKWVEHENLWLQRSAILLQLKYREKTDENRLVTYSLKRANSDEFFVQKAIGWALREYAKTSPDHVQSFVSQYSLKPLSKREALKHFS